MAWNNNHHCFMTEKHEPLTRGLALLGLDFVTSAMCKYQQQFQLDINNLALVVIFNFKTILGFSCRQTFFNIPTTPSPVRCVPFYRHNKTLEFNVFNLNATWIIPILMAS